jgi:hypothetical protein
MIDYLTDSGINLKSTSIHESYERLKKEKDLYDPCSHERVCCIELINNNKIYIRYEKNWIIEDVNDFINNYSY